MAVRTGDKIVAALSYLQHTVREAGGQVLSVTFKDAPPIMRALPPYAVVSLIRPVDETRPVGTFVTIEGVHLVEHREGRS